MMNLISISLPSTVESRTLGKLFSLISLFLFVAVIIAMPTQAASEQRGVLAETQESPRAMIDAITKRTFAIEEREELIRIEEEKLRALRDDVNRKIKVIKKDTIALENILKKLYEIDQASLLGLAKVYENMPPEEAALRLEKIESKFAIRLFKAINSRKAGKILAFVEPKKAARLSEGYGKSLLPEKKM